MSFDREGGVTRLCPIRLQSIVTMHMVVSGEEFLLLVTDHGGPHDVHPREAKAWWLLLTACDEESN